MRPIAVAIIAVVLALAAGCGERRAEGDADGTPVVFHVRLDDAFVSDYHRDAPVFIVHEGFFIHRRPFGYYRDPFCDPWYGPGFVEPAETTTLALLAGDAAGQAQLFRHRLRFGDNEFTAPVRVGRTATLTFVADGGVQGWETVGSVTISGVGQRVDVTLGKDGPKVAVSAPTEPPRLVTGNVESSAAAGAGAAPSSAAPGLLDPRPGDGGAITAPPPAAPAPTTPSPAGSDRPAPPGPG